MKGILGVVFALALIAPPVFSQGMRQQYNSPKKCYKEANSTSSLPDILCVDNSGTVTLGAYASKGKVKGRLNQRTKSSGLLSEYYIEGASLVEYWCFEGNTWMQCGNQPRKTVYNPL